MHITRREAKNMGCCHAKIQSNMLKSFSCQDCYAGDIFVIEVRDEP